MKSKDLNIQRGKSKKDLSNFKQNSAGVRMGKGKGDIDRYVSVVTPGRVLFEVAGVSEDLAMAAFERAMTKLPFKTKIIKKEER